MEAYHQQHRNAKPGTLDRPCAPRTTPLDNNPPEVVAEALDIVRALQAGADGSRTLGSTTAVRALVNAGLVRVKVGYRGRGKIVLVNPPATPRAVEWVRQPVDPMTTLVIERLQAEADAAGAILARPVFGVARAIEHGIDGAGFDDPELRLLIDAAIVLFNDGRLTGDTFGDRERIAILAAVALDSAGLWHPRLAEHFAAIIYSRPHLPNDLFACFRRLGIVAGKVDEARTLARRLAELTEGQAA